MMNIYPLLFFKNIYFIDLFKFDKITGFIFYKVQLIIDIYYKGGI